MDRQPDRQLDDIAEWLVESLLASSKARLKKKTTKGVWAKDHASSKFPVVTCPPCFVCVPHCYRFFRIKAPHPDLKNDFRLDAKECMCCRIFLHESWFHLSKKTFLWIVLLPWTVPVPISFKRIQITKHTHIHARTHTHTYTHHHQTRNIRFVLNSFHEIPSAFFTADVTVGQYHFRF